MFYKTSYTSSKKGRCQTSRRIDLKSLKAKPPQFELKLRPCSTPYEPRESALSNPSQYYLSLTMNQQTALIQLNLNQNEPSQVELNQAESTRSLNDTWEEPTCRVNVTRGEMNQADPTWYEPRGAIRSKQVWSLYLVNTKLH